jgi:hypothetical protein
MDVRAKRSPVKQSVSPMDGGMALMAAAKGARNAVYQARWPAKRDALARANPEVGERGPTASPRAVVFCYQSTPV